MLIFVGFWMAIVWHTTMAIMPAPKRPEDSKQ